MEKKCYLICKNISIQKKYELLIIGGYCTNNDIAGSGSNKFLSAWCYGWDTSYSI